MGATEAAGGGEGVNRDWLCDKVAELEDEARELHESLRDAEHEESVAWDRVRKVERENTRLRELVRDMTREHECCYITWPATITNRMHELGV
jgi:predicted nuclease with TOPRIM domain